ncbi:hypothetical protein SAMN05421858_3421 [Haladaptatus litoreus]|uniref:Uncharacterized protein n=1 Tax=Haladaptatus litoreus TaxID=553468 RepID=A0A1N7D8Q8_9EURY|nr:hypothetical protein SAMN05421858_3421 [Haladaptatus litoreus]
MIKREDSFVRCRVVPSARKGNFPIRGGMCIGFVHYMSAPETKIRRIRASEMDAVSACAVLD